MTSYARNTFRFFYAPTFVELNSEHFSQPGVRVKWQEVIRFMKSVFFDPSPTDPTDSYADQEGGLRYDSTQHKFKYRDNVNWKYFGTGNGDGDVKYDDQGTNGITKGQYRLPRWSIRSGGNYIDSSLVTIGETNIVDTPTSFRSTNSSTGAQYGFMTKRVVGGTATWAVSNVGIMYFNEDTSVFRDAVGSLTFPEADYRLQLTHTGNTRVVARKFIGGLGDNSSVGYLFRCPVTMSNFGFFGSPAATRDATMYSLNIGKNTLPKDNDMIEAKFHISSLNTNNVKTFKIRFNNANDVGVTIPSPGAYDVMVTLQFYRETGSSAKYVISGLGQGTILGAGGNSVGNVTSIDWSADQFINVLLDVSGSSSANELVHRHATWVLHNDV